MASQPSEQIKSTVAKNIKLARAASGLSQRELAQRLDVDQMAVSRWERGFVKPKADNMKRLSALFGLQPAWFYLDHHEDAA